MEKVLSKPSDTSAITNGDEIMALTDQQTIALSEQDIDQGHTEQDNHYLSSKSNSVTDDLRKWFEEYMATPDIGPDAEVVKTVTSDHLSASSVERRILDLIPSIHVTRRYCDACHRLFKHWPDIEAWEHAVAQSSYSTYVIEASTRKGCNFCAFLLQSLKDADLLNTYRKIEDRLAHLINTGTISLSVQNWGANGLSQVLWLNFPGKIGTVRHRLRDISQRFHSEILPPSECLYEEELGVLEVANRWLDNCNQNHKKCQFDDQIPLPSRLVSVAGDTPRLVSTAGWTAKPLYTTLSHCWGNLEFERLTSKTFDQFLRSIPKGALTKTFKEAVGITCSLGVEYIWIDSLCIIQDSESDWQKEAALMTSVYSGSYVNIAASSAINGSQGCFVKNRYFSGGLRTRVVAGCHQRVQEFYSERVYANSTTGTHLATRAWALQEKLLPTRTIHFGERGAFWECKSMIASDFLRNGISHRLGSTLVYGRSRNPSGSSFWRQVVQAYSATQMKIPRDKLPALSGVARREAESNGGQYLAGLWGEGIEYQLCWRTQSKISVRPRWRAPTWSWASIDSQVYYSIPLRNDLESRYCHVIRTSVTLTGLDPFGEIKAGSIHLACSYMVPGRLSKPSRCEVGSETVLVKIDSKEYAFTVQRDCLNEMESDHLVHLLPILGRRPDARMSIGMEQMYMYENPIKGIVLHQSSTLGTFYRLGCFDFMTLDPQGYLFNEFYPAGDFYNDFEEILATIGASTAASVCKEVISNEQYPEERYVIEII